MGFPLKLGVEMTFILSIYYGVTLPLNRGQDDNKARCCGEVSAFVRSIPLSISNHLTNMLWCIGGCN